MKWLRESKQLVEDMMSVDVAQTKEWLDEMGIKNYTINDDGTVDVDGNVSLNDKSLTSIPVQFGQVTGSFYCSHNRLTSLEGAPKEIGGSFTCRNNKKQFTEDDIRRVCNVRGRVYV